jgi:succinoglycan biosynthesis transport protein ExoP
VRVRLNILKHEAAANAELYNILFTRIREAGITAASKSSNARVIDYARILNRPTRPNRTLYLALSAVVALMLGIMACLVKEAFDDRVRTSDDVTRSTGLLSLGTLPSVNSKGGWIQTLRARTSNPSVFAKQTQGFSQQRLSDRRDRAAELEAVRNVRTNILFSNTPDVPRVILVASSSIRDGKTNFASNLAASLAKHAKTCLIDADMRRPQIARCFGVPSSPGFSDLLAGASELDATLKIWNLENLKILPAGTELEDPGELVSSARLLSIVEKLRSRFAYVIIESPPILPFSDGRVLSTLVDGVVLVGSCGITRQQSLRSAASVLSELNAQILGVVVSGVALSSDEFTGQVGEFAQQRRPHWAVVAGLLLAITAFAALIALGIATKWRVEGGLHHPRSSSHLLVPVTDPPRPNLRNSTLAALCTSTS